MIIDTICLVIAIFLLTTYPNYTGITLSGLIAYLMLSRFY